MKPELIVVDEYDNYNGWLEAREVVEVRARVRGHIDRVAFTDGELVKEGQLLFELDPRPFEQELERAKEEVLVNEAQAEFARAESARLNELRKTGGASLVETDKAIANAKSREAMAEAARREVERRKLDLVYAKVTAPISGRVSRATLTRGNLVGAGGSDPLLTTITSIDPMAIYFSVDERALQRYARMRPAAATQPRSGRISDLMIKFRFGLETDQGLPHQGVLDFADNTVDRTTGSILVRGRVDNPDGYFVAGSRVRIRVVLGEGKPCLTVPDRAILSDQDRKYVLVVGDKNIVVRRDIEMGKLLDDGMRVILPPSSDTAGLMADDTIIVQGLQSARLNYPVEPMPFASATANPSTQTAQH